MMKQDLIEVAPRSDVPSRRFEQQAEDRDVTGYHEIVERLRRHDAILSAVAFAAERFLQDPDWEATIQQSLKRLGLATGVDRTYLFGVSPGQDGEVLACEHFEWAEAGNPAQMENSELQEYPMVANGFSRWVSAMQRGESIAGHIADFPPSEQRFLLAQHILSLVVIPIFVYQKWWGFIGFDACRQEHTWSLQELDALRTAAATLGAAIQRRQMEVSLSESRSRAEAILNAVPDLIVVLDDHGKVLDCRPSLGSDPLLSRTDYAGSAIRDHLPAQLAEGALREIHKALEKGMGGTHEFEIQVPLPAGRKMTYEVRLSVIGDNRVLAIVRNITERVELEQMKSDFIDRVAHELRTPLATIALMVKLLQPGPVEQDKQEYWGILQSELKRQQLLVERLLAAGRLEKGGRAMARIVPVEQILREAVNMIRTQAELKGVTLQTHIAAGLPAVKADPDELQQAFVNLLENAVKFTPAAGRIHLSVRRSAGGILMAFKDTGIGIPKDEIPRLFDRYFHASNAALSEIAGSGIGLYLVRSVIDEIGGRIEVTSRLKRGSTFRVWLPAAA